ncbi:MAG TPA: DcaP family trimeric outer membrane transporter [Burkholderiales bacterium]|nr:DcaP family trimeric outer membrane transporter [Burkholderiales bacterium]
MPASFICNRASLAVTLALSMAAAGAAPDASEPKAQAAPANAVTGGATRNSFKLPGSDTSVTLGGYVKLDAILSDKSAGVASVGDQQLNASLIPVGPNAGAHKKDQVTLHARQTRLSLGTSTPTSYGEMKTYVEGDFFGDLPNGNESVTNSSGFRVRHAYGSLGNFSAGQYWTNVFNQDAYAELLDFGGALGELFVRQAQVRWTQAFSRGEWSVSAENPESVLAVPGSATTFRSDSDHVPDLTARVKFNAGAGTYTLGVLGRHIHVDSAAAPAANNGKWGGALAFTGIIPTVGKDDLRLNLNAGNAIGRYQVSGFFPDGYVDAAGRIQLAQQVSGYVAYRHFWTPALRSTLELSAANSNPPAGTFNGINKSDRSQHANLIWSPTEATNLGVEFIHAKRTVTGGDSGSLNRLQFSAQYNF